MPRALAGAMSLSRRSPTNRHSEDGTSVEPSNNPAISGRSVFAFTATSARPSFRNLGNSSAMPGRSWNASSAPVIALTRCVTRAMLTGSPPHRLSIMWA